MEHIILNILFESFYMKHIWIILYFTYYMNEGLYKGWRAFLSFLLRLSVPCENDIQGYFGYACFKKLN